MSHTRIHIHGCSDNANQPAEVWLTNGSNWLDVEFNDLSGTRGRTSGATMCTDDAKALRDALLKFYPLPMGPAVPSPPRKYRVVGRVCGWHSVETEKMQPAWTEVAQFKNLEEAKAYVEAKKGRNEA